MSEKIMVETIKITVFDNIIRYSLFPIMQREKTGGQRQYLQSHCLCFIHINDIVIMSFHKSFLVLKSEETASFQ